MGYIIGVSSGIFGAASTEERWQGTSVGLYRKAQFSITKGVQFVQIDLESISEFQEPDLKDNMKKIERLGISFGFHSETPAFGGREFPHLDSAIGIDYERGHKRLIIVLENTGKLKSKYVLMHSSESTPFILLGRELQPTDIVDFWGRPLEDFVVEQRNSGEENLAKQIEGGSNWLIEWIWKASYLWIDLLGDTPEEYINRQTKERWLLLKHQQRLYHQENLTEREKKIVEEDEKVLGKEVLLNLFFRTIKSKSLHYGPERIAYYIVAKWMEKATDPLWNEIIDTTIKYYAKAEGKSDEEWLEERGIKKPASGVWTIDDPKFREENRLWVSAVSAKYVWGHFNQEKCPDKKWNKYGDPKEKLKDYEMLFLFETPMASPGLEEWLRFPLPSQIYILCKEIGFDITGFAMDIEHMLMCNLDVEASVEVLPEDGGEYVYCIHAGWPAPLGPAHIPIPLGSEQQMYLYKMYYKLRQKGFGKGKDKNYYIVFERGGGADPVQRSVLALRMIVKFLEQDIHPDKLPPEFFGIEVGQIASMERQWITIEEHSRDPLEGLIMIPEEEYGHISRSALSKPGMSPEKWRKEELK